MNLCNKIKPARLRILCSIFFGVEEMDADASEESANFLLCLGME